MTKRDAVVQFAADQLGVKIQQEPLFRESEEDIYGTGWVQVDDQGTPVADFNPFTWDWMGRGMEVCPYVVSIRKD